jgi:hypothetical protein
LRPNSAKFPVKFPVCTEFVRRQVRSVLRRQPAIQAFIDRCLGIAKEPANSGLIGLGALSPRTHFLVLGGQITESLRPTPLIFPFSGDDGRRLGSCWRSRASRYMIGRRTARFTPAAPPSATHPRTSRGPPDGARVRSQPPCRSWHAKRNSSLPSRAALHRS